MEWIMYLLKVSACSALFFAIYLLVLRRLTFFKINRFYLLATFLLSFLIPALKFTIERPAPQQEILSFPLELSNAQTLQENYKLPLQNYPNIQPQNPINWTSLAIELYVGILILLLLLAAWRLFQLLKHTRKEIKKINGLNLVFKANGFTNCSFFNYVFIDQQNLADPEIAVLLKHEEVHVKQLHSIDKLILMLAKVILWFNPIVYLYDKALEEMHEYEADEATSQNVGAEIYANLLLQLAVNGQTNAITHNFVKSPIKQRIKMLFNSKSENMKKLRYLLALPIGMCLLWTLSTEIVYAEILQVQNTNAIVKDQPLIVKTKELQKDGSTLEITTINLPNKKPMKLTTSNRGLGDKAVQMKIYFYINEKLYTAEEVMKFDQQFIAQLPAKSGSNFGLNFDVPGLKIDKGDFIVWLGTAPKPSAYAAKNQRYYEKYNNTTVEGKIIDYTYSASKVLDGFIIKTNENDTLKANVEVKFTKEIAAMINKGDQVTIKIYNANYWPNAQFPVIVSYKLMKDGKLLFDRWPKVSSTKMSINGIENVAVPALNDGNSVQLIAVIPKLLSSSSLTVDTKKDITFIKNGLMEISGDKLEAKEITWLKKQDMIMATNATLKSKTGNLITSEQIIFNLKTGTYQTLNPTKTDQSPSEVFTLLSRMTFSASDSVKVKTVLDHMVLYGKVKLNLDGYNFSAQLIDVDRNTNTIKAHKATLTNSEGLNVSGAVISFDYITKKYTID